MSDIPGSKPRKLIRRTHNSNPSLLSNCISSLFNPEVIVNPKNPSLHNNIKGELKRSASNNIRFENAMKIDRSASQSSSYKSQDIDSLNKAQDQFLKKKLSVSYPQQQRSPMKLYDENEKATQYRRNMGLADLSQLKSFNYLNHQSIKTKQRHGYDIISCVPGQAK